MARGVGRPAGDERRDSWTVWPASRRVADVARRARAQTRAGGGRAAERERPPRSWTPAWIGLAALLVLSVGVGLVQFSVRRGHVSRRGPIRHRVARDVRCRAAARRIRVALEAGPGGLPLPGRVTTEDLRVLTTAADLTAPELKVPRERLSDLAPGARVLWQVVVALPGGETVSSQTFVVRAQ